MADNYEVDNITHIDDNMTYIRMRPGLYLTNEPREVAFREIFDNAFDEATMGYATEVNISLNPDDSFTVSDNGRGIPVQYSSKSKTNGIILTLGTPHSGSKFKNDGKDDGGYSDTLGIAGTNGIGASGTNAISQRFSVRVYKNGMLYEQDFSKGKPGKFSGTEYDAFANFTESSRDVKLRGKKNKSDPDRVGTEVRFTFDDDIVEDTEFNLEETLFRAKCSAMLIPGVTLNITDKEGNVETISGADNGLSAVMEYALGKTPVVQLSGETTFTEKKMKKDMKWSLAIYPDGDGSSFGFVNKVLTPSGGSHINSSFKAIGETMAERVKGMRGLELRKGENSPNDENFSSISSIVVSIDSLEVAFDGQGKKSFESKPMYNALKKSIIQSLTAWSNEKKNAAEVKSWAISARDKGREDRSVELAKKKTVKAPPNLGESLLRSDKLISCEGGYEDGAELFITEGDSAVETVRDARDSRFQAAMPIRGKILNVLGMAVDKSLENAEVQSIIDIIGAGFGKNFDPSKIKYKRVFMATDADYDGYHIGILGMLLFYELMPGLIESGHLYKLYPPLYVITSPNKEVRRYAVDKDSRDAIVAQMKKEGISSPRVQRCKGLGEMEPDDFWDSVMNPETRLIRPITIAEAEKASELLDVLFPAKKNDDTSEQKKEWYRESFGDFNLEEMDL